MGGLSKMKAKIISKAAKAVIFAGGVGTRMWPVSRVNFPKQFEKIINGQSTIQLTVKHLRPEFSPKDIFISTNKKYVGIIRRQLPNIPSQNVIGEPARRDVAPAVGYLMSILTKAGDEPTVILWSDHIRKNLATFKKVLKAGEEFIRKNPKIFLFIGEKARFANQNLGWIQVARCETKLKGLPLFAFKGIKYRPSLEKAEKFFQSKKYYWNPGYWVVKPSFVLEQYKRFQPVMYKKLTKLADSFGQKSHLQALETIYPTLKKISFDEAILEKLEPEKGKVIVVDMGWSDVGTWQALKEALQKEEKDNVVFGKSFLYKSENNLAYNYSSQLVAAVGVKDLAIVVTKDVILVCQQEAMPAIKELVNSFGKSKKYKKYT